MKKILAFLIVAILLISICGCKTEKDTVSADENSELTSNEICSTPVTTSKNSTSKKTKNSTSKKQTHKEENSLEVTSKESSSSKEQQSTSQEEDSGFLYPYEELECRIIPYYAWQTVQINNTSVGVDLQLQLPDDWVLSQSNANTINISRSGKRIGVITSDELEAPEDDFDLYIGNLGNTQTSTLITQHNQNNETVYSHSFEICSTSGEKEYKINMRVDYTELDPISVKKIADEVIVVARDNCFVNLENTNGSKQVLILGNSFISTSKIGLFLSDMLNTANNDYSVNAVSIGMAGVITFANREEILNEISSGKYCYVFICGLYSTQSVDAVQTIKNICEGSNTQLILFPAHNENATMINLAVNNYSDLPILNWKNEVDALINSGVSYNDFCVNDAHQHSTPLAGYVGAHMIYRTLFKENPPTLTYNAPLSEDFVKMKLGNYISSGGEITNKNLQIFEIQ